MFVKTKFDCTSYCKKRYSGPIALKYSCFCNITFITVFPNQFQMGDEKLLADHKNNLCATKVFEGNKFSKKDTI